ncbi:MAG: phosphoenolpyruvate--protein phosphotransferase [Lachnospiraceae bacterium]|nr:phosphoenolpyruvate--protein phosphotransferase [Lachnospiraceae bacterium]
MQICHGKSIFHSIAMGKIRVYSKKEKEIKRMAIHDVARELERYGNVVEVAKEQLKQLHNKALKEVGEADAAIFEIHQMMLEDVDYSDSVKHIITSQRVNVEYAIHETADYFANMFASMKDDYMRGRVADIRDISERLLSILTGQSTVPFEVKEPVILLADDLAPSETVQFDKDEILAFVTVQGSVNSHTAILARTMGIPALVNTQIKLTEELDGMTAIVDGMEGILYLDPDAETVQRMQEKKAEVEEKARQLLDLKGKKDITPDGRKVMLYANIGNPKDLPLVLKNDAQGIGLFRSEFLFMESKSHPTEEEQFCAYKTVAETMAGKRVIIRTLDIGTDKKIDYFNLESEENPALGYRAIRICLTQPDIFKTQLRAILRASVYGNIAIMYPMITSAEEVRQIKGIVEEVKDELHSQKIAYNDIMQGIMIETPAAVMISDELAKEVDFFSIGTNDLTQYTLAIDRQNSRLDAFYDAHHPAVLKMIRMVVENAHKAGIWAGICGELAADMTLTKEFLAMGVDELSVSPEQILPLRKRIREE